MPRPPLEIDFGLAVGGTPTQLFQPGLPGWEKTVPRKDALKSSDWTEPVPPEGSVGCNPAHATEKWCCCFRR